jgi:hypothetical protein
MLSDVELNEVLRLSFLVLRFVFAGVQNRLEIVMVVHFWLFCFSEFVTPIFMEFCMILKLGEILFSGGIALLSLPSSQSCCKFALAW